MRILLDHNIPAPLRYALRGHQVETAEVVDSIQPSVCVELELPRSE